MIEDSMAEVSMEQADRSWNSGSSIYKDATRASVDRSPANHDVSHRLHANAHVCKHARCASNDPHYAVKAPTPPKKFLVAKKHTYGGLEQQQGGNKSTSSDHRGASALHPLTNLQPNDGKARAKGMGRCNSEDGRRLYNIAHSVLQQNRANDRKTPLKTTGLRSSSSLGSGRSLSSSSRRSSTTETSFAKSLPPRKSHLSNLKSSASPTTDQVSSPESAVTTDSASQVMISSPTASVGSNHGTEITSLKDTVLILEDDLFGQSVESITTLSNYSQSPINESLSAHVTQSNEETILDCPGSPSFSSRPTGSESPNQSITSIPAGPSPISDSTAQDTSCITTPGETSSSKTEKNGVDVGTNFDFDSPSGTSTAMVSESPTSTVTSTRLRRSPSSPSTASERSPMTIARSSSSKLADRFINTLKEKSKASSSFSSVSSASAKELSTSSKGSVSVADSSPAASRLTRKFITDLKTSSSAKKGSASTKGVRSIELRGGKAQTFSTTTVTSWNLTSTTVETSVSVSENSPGTIESGVSRQESAATSGNPSWAASTRNSSAGGSSTSAESGIKLRKKVRGTVFEEQRAESETVSLKHGEVAERRLSEEWMTNHALEGVVKNIAENDRRVKVLVHAFETLATLSDSDALLNDDGTLKTQLDLEELTPLQSLHSL